MDVKPFEHFAIETAKSAGEVLMSYFGKLTHVDNKSTDIDLVTKADMDVEQIITKSIQKKFPKHNIIAEESNFHKIVSDFCWVIDPLDGTKEFIKRNGEFTVNIALIHHGTPIMGVIYVPVKEQLYFALEGMGAFKISINTVIDNLDDLVSDADKLPIEYNRNTYVVVGSRSHMSPETEQFFEERKKEYGNVEVMAVGSSLKLCMVAEGKADAYPRYAPTMEWDTGAGHAIAKMAGFSVTQYNTEKEVIYNKEDLLNPWFLAN